MLITPATVALAIPLYKNFRLLKENFYPVMAAILAGIVANCLVSVGFGYFFSLHKEMVISLLPKSVTTAISVDLSHTMGGVNAVTLAIVVSTGIFWFADRHSYFPPIQDRKSSCSRCGVRKYFSCYWYSKSNRDW